MLTRRSTCGAPRHQESRIRCNHNTTNRSCVPSIIGGELNHRWAQEIVIQETNKHSPIHMETEQFPHVRLLMHDATVSDSCSHRHYTKRFQRCDARTNDYRWNSLNT